MRALRILLIVTVILGGLFIIADRVAVGFAEDEAADRLKTNEGLATTPSVSIKGFPFLTQVVGGELDEVEVGIKNYEADTSGTTVGTGTANGTTPDKIRIDDLTAQMRGVAFSGDYSSAKAASATGTATISYDELLKAAKAEPVDVTNGVTAKVVGLSDGGNGKIKVEVEATVLGTKLPRPVSVLSSVSVKGDTVEVHADSLPNLGVQLAEDRVRLITDFRQKIDGLPGGIKLDKVEAAPKGVDITVKGSDVSLVG
ncbi:LmeA family phospholipid-binding protein [Streptomyces phaeochromogenes]